MEEEVKKQTEKKTTTKKSASTATAKKSETKVVKKKENVETEKKVTKTTKPAKKASTKSTTKVSNETKPVETTKASTTKTVSTSKKATTKSRKTENKENLENIVDAQTLENKTEVKETSTSSEETKKEKTSKPAKKKTIVKNKPKKEKKAEEEKTSTKKTKKVEEPYDVLDVEGYHHLKLYTYVFDKIKNPKAVVLIVHGMQEHAGRYIDFATFLNSHGYIVIANDLRGHGHTAIDKKYGYGEKDIYQETVQDEIVMLEKIKDAYNLPVYLFGHSYGSMVSQSIIQNTDIVEKCVLCGTANGSSGIMKAGGNLAKFLSIFKGDTTSAGLVEKMSIKNYGKGFENSNWLSRDEEVLKKYKQDEFCGGTFPFGFYKSMLTNMKKVNKGINKIGNKKIFLIAGSKDPVGSCGKQVKKLNKLYLNNNIDSRCKIYPECRHELLNELNKEEVYNDILNFYEN